jgi:transcriptional regulator with GAF, ATPase, and Fis domain
MPDIKSIWIYSLLHQTSTLPDEVADCLMKSGLPAHISDNYRIEASPGILLLDRLDSRAFQEIEHSSLNGEKRLMVLFSDKIQLASTDTWRVLQSGASDLLVWEINLSSEITQEIKSRVERWQHIDHLVASPAVRNMVVGESHGIKSALRQIIEAACYNQEPILLTGETGTGKELATKLIHTLDPQRNRFELVILDCTTIVPELSGSELFGHERGAFTGAINPRDGAFAMADQGILFLDEVGELPHELQVQLLRVLQEHTYKRVGSNVWHTTDFRLVCATNRNLRKEVESGRFRRDLYYRIANWIITLPPLRERKEDIIPLVHHYLKEGQKDEKPYRLDNQVEEYLLERDYPGNVRDLKNLVLRMKARSSGNQHITLGAIPFDDRHSLKAHVDNADRAGDTPLLDDQSRGVDRSPKIKPSSEYLHQDLLDAYLRQAFNQGLSWNEIEKTLHQLAAQITLEITQGDMIAACQRLDRGDKTFKKWLNKVNGNGKSY